MGLSVVFVSGPRRAGKSALIRAMVERLWEIEPHYIRLVKLGHDQGPARTNEMPIPYQGIASAHLLEFDTERIFETLPDALQGIHRQDRFGAVMIEADADPVLRSAYPYDHRVFVMPIPSSVHQVFRTAREAAGELRRALDDTAAFASEIFGLFGDCELDDPTPKIRRSEPTLSQMRGFLRSPLGDELATRIQLQKPYHGLVESDVVVINQHSGGRMSMATECLKRIDRLMARLRGTTRRNPLFSCDPLDTEDEVAGRLFRALKPMCLGGK